MEPNIEWKSNAVISNEYFIRKDGSGDIEEKKPVNAHEERFYIDQSEKGGFTIARMPEDDVCYGTLRFDLWLNAPYFATGHENTLGPDYMHVDYLFVGDGYTFSCCDGDVTNFSRLTEGREIGLPEFFRSKELYKLDEKSILAELKSCVEEAYDKMVKEDPRTLKEPSYSR